MILLRNIEDKISNITNWDTTAALTNAENKIHNVCDLVKKQIMMRKY